MSEHVETGKVVGGIEAAGDVHVERAVVGALRARDVRFEMAVGGPVLASGNVSLERAGCGPVLCGGDMTIAQGGCGPVLARGPVAITQGGTQSIIAGEARLGSGSFVGIVASPRVSVEEGGRVLMSTPQAAAFGAVAGTIVGLLLLLRRRR